MDNGLIFPYPCMRAHGESVILTALKHMAWSLDCGVCGCVGPDLVVVK